MTGHDEDDRQPASLKHDVDSETGAVHERPTQHDYTCHTCGFTQNASTPPDYCPRCHAETHAESS